MRIEVTYADEPPRIIDTTGESMLSGSAFERAPEWAAGRDEIPIVAVQLRPRTDIACEEGAPLMVEISGWSCAAYREPGIVAYEDLGQRLEAQRLLYHSFRVWEVLPAHEVSRAVDIRVDHRVHLARLKGRLVDLTAFETLARIVLGEGTCATNGLARQVRLVHDDLKNEHPDRTDDEIGDSYGLGRWLFEWATEELEGKPERTLEQERAPFVNEVQVALDAFALDVTMAATPGDLASALDDLVLDVPDMTLRRLKVELERRNIEVVELDELWEEVVG